MNMRMGLNPTMKFSVDLSSVQTLSVGDLPALHDLHYAGTIIFIVKEMDSGDVVADTFIVEDADAALELRAVRR